jgi:hypothetical protein
MWLIIDFGCYSCGWHVPINPNLDGCGSPKTLKRYNSKWPKIKFLKTKSIRLELF